MNEQFDPHRHNAVFQVPDPSKAPDTIAVVLKVSLADQLMQYVKSYPLKPCKTWKQWEGLRPQEGEYSAFKEESYIIFSVKKNQYVCIFLLMNGCMSELQNLITILVRRG